MTENVKAQNRYLSNHTQKIVHDSQNKIQIYFKLVLEVISEIVRLPVYNVQAQNMNIRS